MKSLIDNYQKSISDYFRQLTLALAYISIGAKTISASPQNISIQLTLDKDIVTEPMFLKDLLAYNVNVEDSMLELFQHKLIAAWHDLLTDLFLHFLEQHFSQKRRFTELKRKAPKIDFSSDIDLVIQIREGLLVDFSFEKYTERIRIINGILNPAKNCDNELSFIKKHVFIRNAIQHHEGQVYNDMMKELGIAQLQMLNKEAENTLLKVDDKIKLSIPELDALKRALFRISNEWRNANA